MQWYNAYRVRQYQSAYNRGRPAGGRSSRGTSRPYVITQRRRKYRRTYKGVDKKFLTNYMKITESKFLDTSFTKTPVAATSDVVGISNIGAGDLDDDRDGEQVLVTKIQILLNLLADANLITDVNCELILILKKDCRGASPTVTKVWKTDSINSLRELSGRQNFKILKRWRFHQSHPAIVGSRQTNHYRLIYKFKNPLKIIYLSGDADITASDRNSLSLICMTDAGATFLPNFTCNVRLTFKDI